MTQLGLLRYYQGIFLACFLVDRITKYFAFHNLDKPIILSNFFSFHLVINKGIAWGLLYTTHVALFIVLSGCIIIAISILSAYTIIRWYNHHIIFGEILVLAGAFSNFFDRFLYGGIVDFIVFSYQEWFWPAFNIADSCIVLGAIVMLIFTIRK